MRAYCVVVLGWILGGGGVQAAPPPEKPNFVVILIDDMGYGDIGPYGSKLNRTPQPRPHGGRGHEAHQLLRRAGLHAVAGADDDRLLRQAGLAARRHRSRSAPSASAPRSTRWPNCSSSRATPRCAIGKWHLGDQPEFLPTRHGFDHYLGLPYSNDMGGRQAAAGNGSPAAAAGARRAGDRGARPSRTSSPRCTPRRRSSSSRPTRTGRSSSTCRTPRCTCRCTRARHSRASRPTARYGDWVEEVDWSVGRVLDTLAAS